MKKILLLATSMLAFVPAFAQTGSNSDEIEYGRNLTEYVSKPKVGGYFIGSYKYSDLEGAHGGDGFNVRLVRAYIDGSVRNDFNYRFQVEFNKTVHLKDVFIEWARYKEFKVKVGQFKRAFTFENPYNPWEVGVGDYSQVVKKLAGFSDFSATEFNGSNGGRDIGLQFQGDIFPLGQDQHRLLHYQLAMYNGQGINVGDVDNKKDFVGTIQFQPVKDLYIGAFGWKGYYTSNGVTVERNRYALGLKYEHNGWSARAEYVNHQGQKIADYELVDGNYELKSNASNGLADGWYATVGVPVNDWFKLYGKWDVYREGAIDDNMKSIYSISPNFQLHKNLLFQLQYNFVEDKTANKNYNEIWVQAYIRF